jgi:dephospho-CoA kinase
MIKKVGLTGNIGSGKTTVARILKSLGAAVFNADNEAKALLNESSVRQQLISTLGPQILDLEGMVDRQKLAKRIFNDPEALGFINDLIHPAVRKKFLAFCEKHSGSAYCIYEAAVMIETGFFSQLDFIILVTAPEELRISRVVERDNTNPGLVRQRMKNQWPDEKKIPFAHAVIANDETSPLLRQCLELHEKLLASA